MASTRETPNRSTARLGRRLSGQQGFGLIEVIVAMVLMVIGVLSAFIAYESSQRGDERGERTAALAHHAQSEIERIEAMPYEQIGMKTVPTNSGSGKATDPLNYVVNSPAGYKYDWSSSTSEPFVSGGESKLEPEVAWTEGSPERKGKLFTFVTWVSDSCPLCAKSQDYKRVTVVLTTSGTGAPFIDSTIVTK
jgi:prepilin-type N-terminal cleavage/methylation domain-containing protein